MSRGVVSVQCDGLLVNVDGLVKPLLIAQNNAQEAEVEIE